MSQSQINDIFMNSMDKLRQLVDVNTVVGEPINPTPDVTIIPVSKVTFGFGGGGGETTPEKPKSDIFAYGSGSGVTILPLGFIVIDKNGVQLMHMNTVGNTTDKIVNMVPGVLDKVAAFFSKNKEKTEETAEVTDDTQP